LLGIQGVVVSTSLKIPTPTVLHVPARELLVPGSGVTRLRASSWIPCGVEDLSMTMRITSDQSIGGIPAKDLRNVLRKAGGGFRADWLDAQGFSGRTRKAIVRDLLHLGYLVPSTDDHHEPSKYPWYSLTDLGHSFTRALAAKPITRAHAEEMLKQFIQRVALANQRDNFLARVSEVVVYGSFVRGADSLGDLDLACRLESKVGTGDRSRVYEEHSRKSGRTWSRIGCEYDWAFEEVRLFLKNRKRTISLHDIYDFLSMKKDEQFSYQVTIEQADSLGWPSEFYYTREHLLCWAIALLLTAIELRHNPGLLRA
jgi:predicted nucleotidyltransferase